MSKITFAFFLGLASVAFADQLPSRPNACVVDIDFTHDYSDNVISQYSCDGKLPMVLDQIQNSNPIFSVESSGQISKFIRLGLHSSNCNPTYLGGSDGRYRKLLSCLLTR